LISHRRAGFMIKANKIWKFIGADFEFEITEESDPDFDQDPETQKRVSGWKAIISGVPFIRKGISILKILLSNSKMIL
jgi:hypothetical protein